MQLAFGLQALFYLVYLDIQDESLQNFLKVLLLIYGSCLITNTSYILANRSNLRAKEVLKQYSIFAYVMAS